MSQTAAGKLAAVPLRPTAQIQYTEAHLVFTQLFMLIEHITDCVYINTPHDGNFDIIVCI